MIAIFEKALTEARKSERHYSMASAIIEAGRFEGETLDAYQSQMALKHAFQSAHTGLERALLHVLKAINEAPPLGELVHFDLIMRVTHQMDWMERQLNDAVGGERPPILTGDVARAATNSARLRNLAAYEYGFGSIDDFTSSKARDTAQILATSLHDAIEKFVRDRSGG